MANGIIAKIKDWMGRPVKVTELSKRIAEPSLAGVRTVWHTSAANGLTPNTLANILLEIDQGDSLSYLTLAEEMEERYMHYASVLGDRKRAVTGLPTRVESRSDDEKDVEIADAVRDLISTDVFDGMLFDLMDGIGKGYSVVEPIWDRSKTPWAPSEYKWRDPRFFQFDLNAGEELRMRDEKDFTNGVPLTPYKFIVHRPKIKSGLTLRSGLARMVCVGYMLQGYTLKDWMAFMEVYGMPWRIGKYDASASSEQKTALLNAVRQMGVDAACIIRDDMVIDIVETSKTNGGDKLFSGSANWINDQVSKVVVGQVASTHGTPGRLGNEDSQDAVRKDIKIDDARQLGATIRRDLIHPFVTLNWGPNAPVPYFEFVADEPEDVNWLRDKFDDLIDRGLKVQMSEVRDKLGFEDPEDDADLLMPKDLVSPPEPPPTPETPPGGEPPIEPTSEPEPDEMELQRERRAAIAAIWRRVQHGASVTPEERQLLVAEMALAVTGKDNQDTIDELVAKQLDGARAIMDPILRPIVDLANRAGGYQEFLEGLEDTLANVDSTKFAESVATANLIARGLGDSTDDI